MLLMTYKDRFGPAVIIMRGGRVEHHLWGKPLPKLLADAGRLAARAETAPMPADLARALSRYFAGLPVDLSRWAPTGGGFSAFGAAVYRQTRRLKWGETATYSDIAAAIGRPGAARAVGGALGRNPAPLFIPCHRVLSRRGEGGWSGPPGLKGKLLELERRSGRYKVYS